LYVINPIQCFFFLKSPIFFVLIRLLTLSIIFFCLYCLSSSFPFLSVSPLALCDPLLHCLSFACSILYPHLLFLPGEKVCPSSIVVNLLIPLICSPHLLFISLICGQVFLPLIICWAKFAKTLPMFGTGRKGLLAPQNNFLEKIAKRFKGEREYIFYFSTHYIELEKYQSTSPIFVSCYSNLMFSDKKASLFSVCRCELCAG